MPAARWPCAEWLRCRASARRWSAHRVASALAGHAEPGVGDGHESLHPDRCRALFADAVAAVVHAGESGFDVVHRLLAPHDDDIRDVPHDFELTEGLAGVG